MARKPKTVTPAKNELGERLLKQYGNSIAEGLSKTGRVKQKNPSSKAKERSYDYLKPYQWQKGGPSPNPKGRPPRLSFTEVLLSVLAEPEPTDPQKRSRIVLLAQAIWADAYNGNADMRHAIWDRLDGKVTETVQINSHNSFDKEPIEVESEEAKVVDPYDPERLGQIFGTLSEIGLIPESAARHVAGQSSSADEADEVHAEDSAAEAGNISKTE